jgi:inner membrane protein YhjD
MDALARVKKRAVGRLESARARHPWLDVAVATVKRFGDDDSGTLAAALTYYLFFSVFPLLLFSASLLGRLTFASPELRARVLQAGVTSVPLLADVLRPETLAELGRRSSSLALAALILALYSGTGAIVALQHALARIHRLPREAGWLAKRLRALKWLALLGAGAVASATLGVLAGAAEALVGKDWAWALALLTRLAGAALGVGLAALAFKVLVELERPWRSVVPGALLVGVAFEVLKLAGGVYLASGARAREATFGAFAAAAGFLVAAYLLAQVILLGAALNAVLAERRRLRSPGDGASVGASTDGGGG